MTSHDSDLTSRRADGCPPVRAMYAMRVALCALVIGMSALTGLAPRALAAPTVDAPPATPTAVAAPPHDIPARAWSPHATPLSLPEPPRGFVTERVGPVVWTYPEAARSLVRPLERALPSIWQTLLDDFGATDLDPHLTIRVGRDADEMRALAPSSLPPPPYASGVAYPDQGVILLTFSAPGTGARPNMTALLTHELSHVALRRAVGGEPIPRWFTEGVAVYQANEHSFARMKTLWEASVGEAWIPLHELSERFPSRGGAVDLAYAQSADFIRFLREDDPSASRFRALLAALRQGDPLPEALSKAYDRSEQTLEREWHSDLRERFRALPLLIGGSGIWLIGTVLLVVAYLRKRHQMRRVLARWGELERQQDLARAKDAIALLRTWADAAQRPDPNATDGPEDRAAEAAAAEPEAPAAPSAPARPDRADAQPERSASPEATAPYRRPDSGVPTVEHEGRRHTLH